MTPERKAEIRAVVVVGLLGLAAALLVWLVTTAAARQALLTPPNVTGLPDAAAPVAAAAARQVGYRAATCVAALTVAAMAGSWLWRRRAAAGRQRLTQLLEAIRSGDLESPQRGGPPLPQPWDDLLRLAAQGRSQMRSQRERLDADRRRGFQVLGHMVEGIVAVDHQSRVVLLNPAARHLLGLTRQSLIGRPLVEVVRVPQLIEVTQAVLSGKESGEVHIELEAHGQRRPLRVKVTKLPDGAYSGAVVTVHDESQAQRLETLRRDFVANVSHELKTPLAAIKGYVETVQVAAPDDPEAAAYFLAQINVQCLRLERLINDMLQLARAQSGPGKLTITTVSLTDVAEEAVNAYAAVARAKGVQLTLETPTDPCPVRGNREALLTIANNLIGNAIRYTPASGVVRVGFRRAGNRCTLLVQDTGVGIAPQDQTRVFERFYRVQADRESTPGGTGLGLAIVKHLVQSLRGDVRLTSRRGEGSTFEVLLPIAQQGSGVEAASTLVHEKFADS